MSHQAPFYLTKRRGSPSLVTTPNWGRLALLLVVSVILTLWVATGNVDANILFQSPQSPPVQPAAEQPVAQPPVEQPPAQPAAAEQVPVEQAPVEQAPVDQPPAAQPPAEAAPIEPAPVEQAPAEAAPVEQPPAEQPASEVVAPAAQPVDPTAPEQPAPEPVRREREEVSVDEEEGSSNFILDQAELIDTVVISGAYVWLCCGVGLFLLVPLGLLFVYIRGRSKMMQDL
ncbi:MAG TPA: hypothetical protein VEC96_05490 [Anaerolineae bacterium]|nr:hypothetical protein [Anaerolineae bacterium]